MPRTAVIVGASSEIGAAAATVFARRGDGVALWGRDGSRLERAAEVCREAGACAVSTQRVDVRDRTALEAAVTALVGTGASIGAVVWAAGVFQWGRFDEAEVEGVVEVLETSLVAAAVTLRLFAPALIAAAPSNVVVIGSAAGRRAYGSNAAHVAAKHGLRGLAEALHLDLSGRGVAVTLVTTGVVDAGAGRDAPLVVARPGEVVTVADVARAVAFAVDSGPNVRVSEIVLSPAATD